MQPLRELSRRKLRTALTITAITLGIWALVVFSSVANNITTVTTDVRTDISEQIDAYVAERLAANGTPATAVAVVRGDETVHLAGYGHATDPGVAVTADTPFLIGSVSKPFTGIAVYQLIERGKLSVDEPVGPYIERATGKAAPAFDGVTVEHLVHHTSGLPQGLALPGSVPVRTSDDALDLRIGDIVEQHVRTRDAGAQYEYSNANYILLASIVEQVSGEPFADHVHDEVFEPLGMAASFVTDAHPSAADLVPGHESWFGMWRQSEQPYDPAGAAMGYMGSTARDMAAFLIAELGSDQTALPFTANDVARDEPTTTGWDIPLETGIARGWFTGEIGGQQTVSHAGSLGNYTTHVIMVPGADGLGIAVLRNASAFIAAGHEGQYDLSLGLLDLMLGREPQERAASLLLIVIAPAIAWVLALLIGLSAVRFLVRRSHLRRQRGRALVRRLLPAGAYVAFGLVVLVAVPPLAGGTWATAQLFYPDLAWGLLAAGSVALGWGLARAGLEILAGRHWLHPPVIEAVSRGTGPRR